MATINCLVTNILQNIYFFLQHIFPSVQQKKDTFISLDQNDELYIPLNN